MSKMKFSQILELLHEAAKYKPEENIRHGLKYVGLHLPEESPLFASAVDFRKHFLSVLRDTTELSLLTERARDRWKDEINVTYLEVRVHEAWVSRAHERVEDKGAHPGGD